MSKPRETLAVFPGAFDPVTHGHLDIAYRASDVFGRLIVAVGVNPEKPAWFTAQERVDMVREALGDHPDVVVHSYDGLTMDYVRSVGARVLVRGIRDTVDLRDEIRIANVNRMIGGVETVFLMTDDEHVLTASSLIKQIVDMGGLDEERMARLVPQAVVKRLAAKLKVRPQHPHDPNMG
jgi:pantetheine-phosphate adenylyltransferase